MVHGFLLIKQLYLAPNRSYRHNICRAEFANGVVEEIKFMKKTTFCRSIALILYSFLSSTLWAASNQTPTANTQSVVINEDTSSNITLTGTDPEGSALTYGIASNPTRGTLTCSGPSCRYTPSSNINGSDSFYFYVSDGSKNSRNAKVSITISAVNDLPTATAQSAISLNEDQSKSIYLSGSDIDRNTLTYSLYSNPSHGTATLSGSTVIYTPTANDNGSDSFTFRAHDGTGYSSPATISLTVNALNDVPTTSNTEVSMNEDTSKIFLLNANDVDGDTLSTSVSMATLSGSTYSTRYGSFTVSGIQITYTPNANFTGEDTFLFTVNDGISNAPQNSTVTINVNAVNDAPIVENLSGSSGNGKPTHFVMSATDEENDSITYRILTQPANGHAAIWNENRLVYIPETNFDGTDTFAIVASDGLSISESATITIEVSSDPIQFELNALSNDPNVSKTTTDSSQIFTLPLPNDPDCSALRSSQPVIPVSQNNTSRGYGGVVATHYRGLECGSANYKNTDTSIYIIANTGSAGDFEAYKIGDGYNIEASGLYLDNGTLLFPVTGGAEEHGGLVSYQVDRGTNSSQLVTNSLNTFYGSAVDSSPYYDNRTGLVYTMSANTPETCGDALSNNCGSIAVTDLYGEVLDRIDEDDNHHAWGSGGWIEVDGKLYGGFAVSSDSLGPVFTGTNTCTVASMNPIDTPDADNSTVSTTLSLETITDFGTDGCTPVADLESAIINGGIISDGTYLYVIAYGSDRADAYTYVHQLYPDLSAKQTFAIPADYSHSFTNGFYNSLLAGANGNIYITGLIDEASRRLNAIIEINPNTQDISVLYSEVLTSETNAFNTGHLYLDANGDEVMVFTGTGYGYVLRLADSEITQTFALGTNSRHIADATLISDGDGAADALMFVSADNVITIIPNTGLSESLNAPWPSPGQDRLRQRHFE